MARLGRAFPNRPIRHGVAELAVPVAASAAGQAAVLPVRGGTAYIGDAVVFDGQAPILFALGVTADIDVGSITFTSQTARIGGARWQTYVAPGRWQPVPAPSRWTAAVAGGARWTATTTDQWR